MLYNFFGDNNPCFLSSLRFLQVVELLVQTGAHLTESPLRLGEVLVSAAAADNVERLKSYHIAGADLSCADPCGRTALHAVRGAPWPGGGRWGLAWVLMSWGGDSVSVCCLIFLWAGYLCVCVCGLGDIFKHTYRDVHTRLLAHAHCQQYASVQGRH